MKLSHVLTGTVLAGGLVLSGAAFAQGASQPPATPGAPTDVKPIGDWTVRCFPVASVSPCDMYEELDDKNSRQRVIGVSIAYVPDSDRHVAQIAVPLGVSIGSGVVIQTDTYTSPKLAYRRCDRTGCFVEMLLPQDIVAALGRSGPNASINIVADNGKAYPIKFSLNGFSGAHDAMTTLARQKATKNPPPAAAPPAQ